MSPDPIQPPESLDEEESEALDPHKGGKKLAKIPRQKKQQWRPCGDGGGDSTVLCKLRNVRDCFLLPETRKGGDGFLSRA